MTDPRPREFAAEMLIALRKWWKEYQEANVPEHLRAMTTDHVVNEMAKSIARKNAKKG